VRRVTEIRSQVKTIPREWPDSASVFWTAELMEKWELYEEGQSLIVDYERSLATCKQITADLEQYLRGKLVRWNGGVKRCRRRPNLTVVETRAADPHTNPVPHKPAGPRPPDN
jgi:hypothetical protein